MDRRTLFLFGLLPAVYLIGVALGQIILTALV